MKTKTIRWTAALAVLFTLSCEKEELDKKIKAEESSPGLKTIIVNGEPLYAGYGYDPGEDRAFRNAVHPENIYESTEIQPGLSMQFSTVTNREEIEEHSKEEYSITRKKRKFFGLSKSTHTTTRSIETYIKINEESISIIAKVRALTQRFLVDAEPRLVPPAQNLLDKKMYERFLDNYGHFYVSDRTIGGELQYVYNFKYCKIDKWSKATFVKKAESKVLGMFGKKTATTLTNEEKYTLEKAQENVHMLSSVPGYDPRIVNNIDDANRETQRLLEYLEQYPEKATTIDMELKPYSELVADAAFSRLSGQKEQCLKLQEAYELQYNRLHYVYNNASDANKRKEAYNDMQDNRAALSQLSCGHEPPFFEQIFEQKYGNLLYSSPCHYKLLMRRWATQQGGYWDSQKWLVGDFNGDGKDDLANVFKDHIDKGKACIDVHLSTGSGFKMQRWATHQGGYWGSQKWMVGDFNGDGKDDLAKAFNDAKINSDAIIDVHLSNGSSFSMKRWATYQGGYWNSQKWMSGDFDGDGKDDLAKAFNDARINSDAIIDVHLSNGSSFSMKRWATYQGGYWDTQKWMSGDFDGDGKDDLAKAFNDARINSDAIIDVHLSNGSSFSMKRWATYQGGYWNSQKWMAGDFDGDGKDDLAKAFNDARFDSDAIIDVHLSNGDSFSMKRWATYQGGYWDSQKWMSGDFRGDGSDDFTKAFYDNGLASIDVHETKRMN